MWRSPEPRYDVASALCQGGRDYQEDAIVTDFPFGSDSGVVVLADGMGGHAAGDVASKIVVTEVYSELKFQSANFHEFEKDIPTMSIGDSPLYLMRGGKLRQLNEDHSMAPQIDFMVQSGLLDAEVAKNHPDRNCLTSVILGDRVAKSDCPTDPFGLEIGDIVVVSSDGLQYLDEPVIQKILHKYRRRKSAEIAGHLLEAIERLADVDQDNVSFALEEIEQANKHAASAAADAQEPPLKLVSGGK